MKKQTVIFISFILLLVSFSCKRVNVLVKPYYFLLGGNIEFLKDELKKQNIMLVYENSYEGEDKGIRKYYYNAIYESIYYHVELFTIESNIKSLEIELTSNELGQVEFYDKIDKEIIPKFKKSTDCLNFVEIKRNKGQDKGGKKWFNYLLKVSL